jgi:hypothetical protein
MAVTSVSLIAVQKILTGPGLPWVALGCVRIGRPRGGNAGVRSVVADGSRHRARVFGTVALLGHASRIGPAQRLFVEWMLWRPTQCCAHG